MALGVVAERVNFMNKVNKGFQRININTSVCMATYNGERFLPEQIDSIISQMGMDDELVVVDDASSDRTVSYLESLSDSRIKIYKNKSNIGHVQSFAKALGLAQSAYIFMADQDDVWIVGRLAAMREVLAAGSSLVSTNSKFINNEGRAISPLHPDLKEKDSDSYISNIIRIFIGKAFYNGCAMGLRKELLQVVLPIPSYVESHDLWIAMVANSIGSSRHLENYTLYRRVHGGNASVLQRAFWKKLRSRAIFLLSLLHIGLRLIKRA